VRTYLSAALVVLVALLVPVSAVAYWADHELGNADRYTAAMSPLANDPAVQGVVVTQATRALSGQIDAGPFQGGVDALMGEALHSFAGTPAYRTAWDAANRAAHTAFLDALDSGRGDAVTIDLAPVIAQVRGELVADGVPFADRIPETHLTVKVMEYDNLGALRKGFHMLQVAGVWLPALTVLLAVAAVAVAVRRRRALLATGLGLAGRPGPPPHPRRPAGRHRPGRRRSGVRRAHRVPADHRLGGPRRRARGRAGRMAGGPAPPHPISSEVPILRRTPQKNRFASGDTEAE
jgi:hypothetical protein